MTDIDQRARVICALDQLDGAFAELGHWLATGERVECPVCIQLVPASASGMPVRHQLRGQWCTPAEKATIGR
jgi:hypothetical protein